MFRTHLALYLLTCPRWPASSHNLILSNGAPRHLPFHRGMCPASWSSGGETAARKPNIRMRETKHIISPVLSEDDLIARECQLLWPRWQTGQKTVLPATATPNASETGRWSGVGMTRTPRGRMFHSKVHICPSTERSTTLLNLSREPCGWSLSVEPVKIQTDLERCSFFRNILLAAFRAKCSQNAIFKVSGPSV